MNDINNKISKPTENKTVITKEVGDVALDQPCQDTINGAYEAINPANQIVTEEELLFHDGTANKPWM